MRFQRHLKNNLCIINNCWFQQIITGHTYKEEIVERRLKTKSKYYISASCGYSFFIIMLNIAVIIYIIKGVIELFTGELSIYTLGQISIAIIASSNIKERKNANAKYKDVYATLIAGEDENIRIVYKDVYNANQKDVEILIRSDKLESIEFSDKLSAFRFKGLIEQKIKKGKIQKASEWLFYIEDNMLDEILELIQEKSNLNIKFVDR